MHSSVYGTQKAASLSFFLPHTQWIYLSMRVDLPLDKKSVKISTGSLGGVEAGPLLALGPGPRASFNKTRLVFIVDDVALVSSITVYLVPFSLRVSWIGVVGVVSVLVVFGVINWCG